MTNPHVTRSIDMIHPDLNVDLLNDVEVYDDNFTRLTKCPAVEEFQWFRRFSRTGEFILTTSFSEEKMELYRPPTVRHGIVEREGNIIYKRDNDEACMVTGRSVIETKDGDLRLIARGRALSQILDRRIISMNGDFTLNGLLSTIIIDNFLAEGVRSMAPLLRLMPLPDFGGEPIPVDFRRSGALQNIENICHENEIGFKVKYNIDERTFDLVFYNPAESAAIFSKEWTNVLEQDYFDETLHFKNVVLVGEDFIHNNDIVGLSRREMATPEPQAGQTRFLQTALDALNRNAAVRTLSSRIYVNSTQFKYGTDWDLGSIVLSQNREIGYSEKEIAVEIVEFFDKKGRHIDVNTGSYLGRL